jgi:Domain of unknown function (DUF4288)
VTWAPVLYPERVARKRTSCWYGVRTLIRLIATGKPTRRDEHFDPDSTMVEDRVVLFKAQSLEHAIEQAENEARRYCQAIEFKNMYGQRVRLKYIGAVDAFSMLDNEPSPGCEVYSSTSLVPKSISDSRLTNERFGARPDRAARSRFKFLDAVILSDAFSMAAKAKAPARTQSVPSR